MRSRWPSRRPSTDLGFYGLMALLGLYVGIVPVTLGMLWLPFVRRIDPRWMRVLMALTVGLLAFLAIDATLEGIDVAGEGSQALGGASLVFLGGLDVVPGPERRGGVAAGPPARRPPAPGGAHVAMLVAIAIGLHNLGEGLAIGSAYAVGALALGAFLVIGFALHNTTEGLAIVAPVAQRPARPRTARPARADRRSAGHRGRLDRRLGLQLEPGGIPARAPAPARSCR